MGLPAPILSGPSILYLGLAAYKYSNKVHLSMLFLEDMLWMKWQEYRPHSPTQYGPDKYTRSVYHCTSLLCSTFAPTLAFSRLLIEYVRRDESNQPRLL